MLGQEAEDAELELIWRLVVEAAVDGLGNEPQLLRLLRVREEGLRVVKRDNVVERAVHQKDRPRRDLADDVDRLAPL